MTIEQRADDPAVDHAGESLVVLLDAVLGDALVALAKLLICRPLAFAGPHPKQVVWGA